MAGAAGHTRHFDPSHSAMAEVICASSGWRLENFCVKRNSRAPEGRLQTAAIHGPDITVHENRLTEGDCNDPLAQIITTAAILQLAFRNENSL